jgi:hypothetical protein
MALAVSRHAQAAKDKDGRTASDGPSWYSLHCVPLFCQPQWRLDTLWATSR